MPNKNRKPATLVAHATNVEADIAQHMQDILLLAGENPNREGLVKTPARYARAFLDLTSGYDADFSKIANDAIFSAPDSGGLVLVRDIELFSLCEHHLLPFFGKAHVAYVPDGKVIGLSKIPRIVDAFSNRLQIQEKLTEQIAEELMQMLAPKGVAVFIEAYHMCIMMRGVEKQSSRTVTNCFKGVFKYDTALRSELFDMIKTSDR